MSACSGSAGRTSRRIRRQRGEYGTDLAYLRSLVDYWRDGFDWRAQEAQLNALPQFTVAVGGIQLHFLHVPGIGPSPMPLVVSHGWPGSVLEFHKLIPLLTDPARHGGDAADAFTVIAPSLPGLPSRSTPGQPRFALPAIADLFAELMVDVLGYERFGAQGGDFGAFISLGAGAQSRRARPRHPPQSAATAPRRPPGRATIRSW